MIEQIKRDRFIQFMLVIVAVLVLFVCAIFGATAWTLLSRNNQAAPAPVPVEGPGPSSIAPTDKPASTSAPPTVTPTQESELVVDKQEFKGEGNKIEFFTIYREGPVYFSLIHRSTRQTKPFFVTLKDANGNTLEFLATAQGNSENETVENLPPGDYILEISGEVWVIAVLHNK